MEMVAKAGGVFVKVENAEGTFKVKAVGAESESESESWSFTDELHDSVKT